MVGSGAEARPAFGGAEVRQAHTGDLDAHLTGRIASIVRMMDRPAPASSRTPLRPRGFVSPAVAVIVARTS